MKTKPKTRKIPKAQRSRTLQHQLNLAKKYMAQQEKAEQDRIQAILDKPHTLSMDFVLEHVKEKLDAFHAEHGLSMDPQDKSIFIPESVVIDAYNQDNLIIALKMQQVNCSDWMIGVDTHLYNYDTEEVLTIPYQVKLDCMTYAQVQNETKVTVDRPGGFKTRWKGLSKELEDHYKNYKERDLTGFSVIQTQMKFAGECYFVSYKMYLEYLFMNGLRNEGVLMEFLENLTKTQVEAGNLNYQLQPTNQDFTAIPVSSFDPLLKEASSELFNINKISAA